MVSGTFPVSIAVADFNGDGKPDLAVANNGDDNVAVFLGRGNGQFTAAAGSPFAVGSLPMAVVAGDLNGDGRPDLAVANFGSGVVTILAGTGSGFTGIPYPPYGGSGAVALAIGDFDGDGRRDLAVANLLSNDVEILLQSGNAVFSPATAAPLPAGANPQAIVAGDLNRDGIPDLVVVNKDGRSVTVMNSHGQGGFAEAAGSPFAVGKSPVSALIGDFNGDGWPDIAVANSGDNTVTVLLADGMGGFQPGNRIAAGALPQGLAAGDFNKDGRLDLAVANEASNTVTVLLGGTAATTTTISAPTSPPVAAGDMVTLHATVSSTQAFAAPTGQVQFHDGTSLLGGPVALVNGAAEYTIASITAGSHTLSAEYLGDADSAPSSDSTVLTIGPPPPVWKIEKKHTGDFKQGATGTYLITVTNTGAAASTGRVTVTDMMPYSLTATSISGNGWLCGLNTLTCVRTDSLAAGKSYDPITITVRVGSTVLPRVINTAEVSGGGGAAVDVSDPTNIVP